MILEKERTKIGSLDRRIEIKQIDFDGVDDVGQRTSSESDLATVWAKMNFNKGGSSDTDFEAQKFIEVNSVEIIIRHRSDISVSPKNHIIYNGNKYFIRSVREFGRRRYLIMNCENKR